VISRFVFVTGLSGAGKSQTLHVLEDFGYFCIDNLPPPLIPKFADLIAQSPREFPLVAIGVDIRERAFLEDFWSAFDRLKAAGHIVELVFLEAEDSVLMRRFSETRRPHPLSRSSGLPLLEAIQEERQRLAILKDRADRIVDSSQSTTAELKIILGKFYGVEDSESGLIIYLLSFGFKFGLPMDSDMVFDVRFFPNPNYDPALRLKTGLDPAVWTFLESRGAREYLESLEGFLKAVLPRFSEERRSALTISVGCTGGRHRSVGVAEHLGKLLKNGNYKVKVAHRDIEKDALRYRTRDGTIEDRNL
jgi:UPF0042 nucleotide-binding protein